MTDPRQEPLRPPPDTSGFSPENISSKEIVKDIWTQIIQTTFKAGVVLIVVAGVAMTCGTFILWFGDLLGLW